MFVIKYQLVKGCLRRTVSSIVRYFQLCYKVLLVTINTQHLPLNTQHQNLNKSLVVSKPVCSLVYSAAKTAPNAKPLRL